ncbi:MAG TPA: biotin synthase BioB, partial [Gammaproteobacteria bacterium]|nr:biotin synthase BioB [Gammaproteobacteria bacterium]
MSERSQLTTPRGYLRYGVIVQRAGPENQRHMSVRVTEIEAHVGASLPLAGAEISCEPRSDWTQAEVAVIFELPFGDLLYGAQWVHRQVFDPNTVQISTLLSIKTGACPEDCTYCPQSVRYDTGVEVDNLMSVESVKAAALRAKESGATRFCMGAAYRGPKDQQVERIAKMIGAVRALGLETCATLGLLTGPQAQSLADAGLDFYNHNLDTSESFYSNVITTRRYADRLETLEYVRAAGIKVCCGGILGLGETREDRIGV